MSLTFSHGPLAGAGAGAANYRLDGPGSHLFFDAFPRRVRAVFAGETVVDTTTGMLLHRTGVLPQLYVPQSDVLGYLLQRDEDLRDEPGLGRVRYSALAVGGRSAPDAVWSVEEPEPGSEFLTGYSGISSDAVDGWFDEDEPVLGHLCDPYHRVDVRSTSRRVRVVSGSHVLAESEDVLLLSETGLPNRLYVPAGDVDTTDLVASTTSTTCAYKGTADYVGVRGGPEDVAWRYVEPLPESSRIAGYWCFDETKVEVRSDNRRSPRQSVGKDPQPPTRVMAPADQR